MEFFFADPDHEAAGGERTEPAQTRLLDLRAEPYPDGRRLRVALELTPFKQRPDIELTLQDSSGQPAATASIVEPVGWTLELTLHIRRRDPAGSYQLAASLGYEHLGEVDHRRIAIQIPTPTEPHD